MRLAKLLLVMGEDADAFCWTLLVGASDGSKLTFARTWDSLRLEMRAVRPYTRING